MVRHRRPCWLLWCICATVPVTGFQIGGMRSVLSRSTLDASAWRQRQPRHHRAAAAAGAARLGRSATPLIPPVATLPWQQSATKWRSPMAWIRRFWWTVRRRALLACLGLWVGLALTQAAWAVTGGRVGGSFGPSESSSRAPPPVTTSRQYYRPSSPSSRYGYSSGPSRTWLWFQTGGSTVGVPVARWDGGAGAAVSRRLSVADGALLGGTGALLTYGFYNNHQQHHRNRPNESPLGPGATVASLVVALGVPDRQNPSSVLQRLRRISEGASTGTRRGVQDLVVEVCLELARQERSVVSAVTGWRHFGTVSLAEREFQGASMRNRSKFDRESVNKFGSEDRSDRQKIDDSPNSGGSKATSAVVSINIAIEGDSTKLPRIRNRNDLAESLEKLASDAQVEDCLLSAEILWAPDDAGETLAAEDIYADYPNLIPL